MSSSVETNEPRPFREINLDYTLSDAEWKSANMETSTRIRHMVGRLLVGVMDLPCNRTVDVIRNFRVGEVDCVVRADVIDNECYSGATMVVNVANETTEDMRLLCGGVVPYTVLAVSMWGQGTNPSDVEYRQAKCVLKSVCEHIEHILDGVDDSSISPSPCFSDDTAIRRDLNKITSRLSLTSDLLDA